MIKAIDLFCGAGGLTHGLELAGIDVIKGVDIDPACKFPYTTNNNANFVQESIEKIKGDQFSEDIAGSSYVLLAGCAPCQPFSALSRNRANKPDGRQNLLDHFGRIAKELEPDFIAAENVPGLARQTIFKEFVVGLEDRGFWVFHNVVNCAGYGVPQQRKRLVLLASKHGSIEMNAPDVKPGSYKTVRDAIGDLPRIGAGEACLRDPLHLASKLSALNLERIRASIAGGTRRDWDKHLVADCHKKETRKTYCDVYGRMTWDKPSPTITTKFFGFSNGRFGHPSQDRAISLREGSILQSFPRDYAFVPEGETIRIYTIARLIGNAVPVKLGKVIGESIKRHIEYLELPQERPS